MSNQSTFSFARALVWVLIAAGVWTGGLQAQAGPSQPAHHGESSAQQLPSSDFISAVREATARFKDVAQAEKRRL